MVPKNQSFVHKVLHTGGNDSINSCDFVRKHYRKATILTSCNSIAESAGKRSLKMRHVCSLLVLFTNTNVAKYRYEFYKLENV